MNLRELQAAIAHYGVLRPDGGPLHIVIHDHNLDHPSLDYCWGQAAGAADGEAIAIVNALRVLPMAERALAVHPIACRRCGHSEVSHESPLGGMFVWGAGACTVDGCDCPECDS